MSLLSNPWFNVGMGLLANSGPSLTPVNPWRGIGQGLMAANEAKAMEAQQAYEQKRMEMEQQKMAQEQQRQQMLQQWAQTQPDPTGAALFPEKAYEMANKPPADSVSIKTAGDLGLQGYAPETPVEVKMSGGQIVDYTPMQPSQGASAPSSIQEYNLAKSQGYPGTFQQWTETTGTKNDVSPYYTPVYSEDGILSFNNRAGTVSPLTGAGGQPVMRATDSPELQGQIAGSRKGEEVKAESKATAQVDLPRIETAAQQTLGLVRALRDHPGMSDVVGVPSALSLGGRVPATEGADFRARLEQVTGQQFLQAYQTLKGSGQITEIEGKKAQDAIARMQTAQSERSFKAAADEFISIIEKGVENAKKKAGGGSDGWSIKVKN